MKIVIDDAGACHRCGGELYLYVAVPHPTMPGHRKLALCPRCDAHDPAAQDLLAWLSYHGKVDVDVLPEFEELVAAWVAAKAAVDGVSAEQVEEDLAAWRRGELD